MRNLVSGTCSSNGLVKIISMASTFLCNRSRVLLTIGVSTLSLLLFQLVTTRYRRRSRRHRRGRYASGKLVLSHLPKLQGMFGFDVGGTLAKTVYLHHEDCPDNVLTKHDLYGTTGERLSELEFYCPELKGTLHFVKCETQVLESTLPVIKNQANSHNNIRELYVSGGGAFKFASLFEKNFAGLELVKLDELLSLIEGITFLKEYGPPGEVYKLEDRSSRYGHNAVMVPVAWPPAHQPILLVNIGSGVSILKLHNSHFERVGGTGLGGGTFMGLCRLITNADSYESAIDMATRGDHSKVDKLVQDIYGGDYEKYSLSGNLVASCFGKLSSMENPRSCRQEDIALALLRIITLSIALLAVNIAKLHKCTDSVFFVGGFLRYNPIAHRSISEFCRVQNVNAKFLKHSDFLGAIGALRVALSEESKRGQLNRKSRTFSFGPFGRGTG